MQLDSLAAGLVAPEGLATQELLAGKEVTGLTADSRKVQPGVIFFAVKGVKADGWTFVPQALKAGAVAIVTDHAGAEALTGTMPESVPLLVADEPRHVLSVMAARFYGKQPKTMVAVTGTAGKTSVAYFVRQIFQKLGHASASLGTIGTVTEGGRSYGGLTSPDPVSLHGELARLAKDGITHAALEASSHGLSQHRLDGVRLVAAAFTNLGRDHMDYHPTVEDYLQAKLRLFADVLPAGGTVVVEPSVKYADRVLAVAAERKLRTLTVGEGGADLKLVGLKHAGFCQVMTLATPRGDYKVSLPLAGRFQVSNALIAAGLAIASGEEIGAVLRTLESLKGAPGRLELVGRTKEGALVFVDYAHKPDALKTVLTSLRPFTSGRLVVAFGAGGDRDHGKRPLMGEAAAELADVTIVTDDNPRSEDPATIRKAILAAAPDAIEIGDRHDAIVEGIKMLKAGDVFCVAGKGHETGQIVGDTVLPFSDHDVILKALEGSAK